MSDSNNVIISEEDIMKYNLYDPSTRFDPETTVKTSQHKYILCSMCSIYFKSYEQVQEHMNQVHINPLIEPQENEKYNVYDSDTIVKSLHFKCVLCSIYFNSYEEVREHVNKLHINLSYEPQEKKLCFRCNICYKTFNSFDEEKIHKKEVHGPWLRYSCEQCPKKFTRKAYLREHIESKHEGMVYKCSKCSKSYALIKNLKAHLNKVHSYSYESMKKLDAKSLQVRSEDPEVIEEPEVTEHKDKEMNDPEDSLVDPLQITEDQKISIKQEVNENDTENSVIQTTSDNPGIKSELEKNILTTRVLENNSSIRVKQEPIEQSPIKATAVEDIIKKEPEVPEDIIEPNQITKDCSKRLNIAIKQELSEIPYVQTPFEQNGDDDIDIKENIEFTKINVEA